MANDNVNWQMKLPSIGKRFEKLYDLGLYFDCEFSVGSSNDKKTMKAHRIVLATASPVFSSMLYGDLKEVGPVKIPDIEPNVFEIMIRYIYTDEVDELTSLDDTCDIYKAANKYMIINLIAECGIFITKKLLPENVCQILEFAKLHEDNVLLEKCIYLIQRKTGFVIRSQSFLEANVSTLETILSQETLSISEEIELWDACLRWASAKCEKDELEVNPANQRTALQAVIHLIRCLVMKPKQFSAGPALTNILTKDECSQILLSICSQTNNISSDLCTLDTPRSICHDYFSCKIGGSHSYQSSFNEEHRSSIVFKCSTHILMDGIRIPNQKNHPSTFIHCTISDVDGCKLGKAFADESNPARSLTWVDYIFGGIIRLQPDHWYKLSLKLGASKGYNRYTIVQSPTSNNVTFNIFQDQSSWDRNGCFAGFQSMLFSLP